MSRFTKFLLLVVLILLVDATSTTLSANKTKPIKFSVLDYINQYKNIAVKEMQRTRIPASITLAQGILESKYGNSYLARNANNHFGIKCHRSWSGKAIYATDDEANECFRKYSTGGVSYRDHSNFLRNNSRYSFLFKYKPSDYRSWATGLGKAGYATNSKYGSHLIRIIERYQLHSFDRTKQQIQQDRLARAMRDYQLRLKGMMNHEDLYPTWFINDRPSQPSLLHSIKRRTPMSSSTYSWSTTKNTAAPKTKTSRPKVAAKPKPKPVAAKPKPKPKVATVSKAKKPVVAAKKAKTAIAKTAPKKAVTKPAAKKKAVPAPKKTIAAKTKPVPTPATPKKTVAATSVKKTNATVAKTSKAHTPKLDGELFSALNNWKKKTDAKKQVAVSSKKATPKTQTATTSKTITHTVKAGDTLYSLARKYNTKVEVIKKSNQLSGNELKLGTRLVIRP